MSGLYQRALYIRTQEELLAPQDQKGNLTFDEDSGIPLEEQKEILKQIESVVADNRIAITKDLLKITPQKNGLIFPLVVNFLAVIFTIAMLFLMPLFIGQEKVQGNMDNAITDEYNKIATQIKKENEEQLKAKDEEVTAIQGQLENLNAQKEDLQKNMDEHIATETRKIQEEMEASFKKREAELEAQGISREEINRQMEELKSQQEESLRAERERITREAEGTLKEREKELSEAIAAQQATLKEAEEKRKKLEEEYSQRLAKLEKEKEQKIEEEVKAREEEMRAALEASESNLSNLSEEAAKARAELEKLNQQKQKEQQLRAQLNGLYNNININFQEKDFAAARNRLEELKDFFKQEETVLYESFAEQRGRELFIIDALGQLLDSEESRQEISTSGIIEKAAVINEIRNTYLQAEQAAQNGDTAAALASYGKILETLPEIKESYLKNLEYEQAQEASRFASLTAAGNSQFAAGEYGQAVETFSRAIAMTLADNAQMEKMINSMLEAGYQLKGSDTARKEDNARAADLLKSAEKSYKDREYDKAMEDYLSLITRYPRSTSVSGARDGLKKSAQKMKETAEEEKDLIITGLNTSLEDQKENISTLEKQVTKKDSSLEELEAQLTSREEKINELNTRLSDSGNQADSRNAEVLRLTQVEIDLKAAIEELNNKNLQLQAELAAAEENMVREARAVTPEEAAKLEQYDNIVKNLENLEKEKEGLKTKYYTYAEQEDSAVETKGNLGYLAARPYLGEVFNSPLGQEVFPGFYERLKKYETALAEDARVDGSYVAVESMIQILDERLNRKEDPLEFWNRMKEEYKDDPVILEGIKELQSILD